MELAVLAPKSALSVVSSQKYQIALTSCMDDLTYREFFQIKAELDRYIILQQDNRISLEYLIYLSEMVGVSEVILPYIKNRNQETLDIFKETTREIVIKKKLSEIVQGLHLSLMVVGQGSPYQITKFVKTALSDYAAVRSKYSMVFRHPLVIGLRSSDISNLTSDEVEKLSASLREVQRRGNCFFHIVDWNGQMSQLKNFKVRSVSTAIPFQLAVSKTGPLSPGFFDTDFANGEKERATNLLARIQKNTKDI